MNRELISEAVTRRLADVRERVGSFEPQQFAEMSEFVLSIQNAAMDQSRVAPTAVPEYWVDNDGECLDSLRMLSLGKPITIQRGFQPPTEKFLQKLSEAAKARQSLFALLVERYSCPLNFALPAEGDVRELLLMRLMVPLRARIEKISIAAADADDLLLILNLIAVHAAMTTDLRFVDALNYYYESLPATWKPEAEHSWLLVSYLALYARALRSWR